jgi:methionyl-tRNA formyltransferase
MSSPRVIFMGTPDFAVATLNALRHHGIEVVGVVTAPDRPAGRGRQLRASPVKLRAVEAGIPVLQPERLKDPAFHEALDALDATLYIVVAFRMLPEAVWGRPALGTINLHASLLPDYRGAAPINWAVINGERKSGVTTFLISHEIDTGDILLQQEIAIGPDETAGELHDRMMGIGAELVVATVNGLAQGSLQPQAQDALAAKHAAPKIDSATCHIDHGNQAQQVHDLVRGMSPFPGAWCTWNEEGRAAMHFKILRTRTTGMACDAAPGTVRIEDEKLRIACADEWIEALEVQPEGKRRMEVKDFIRGIRSSGTILLR